MVRREEYPNAGLLAARAYLRICLRARLFILGCHHRLWTLQDAPERFGAELQGRSSGV